MVISVTASSGTSQTDVVVWIDPFCPDQSRYSKKYIKQKYILSSKVLMDIWVLMISLSQVRICRPPPTHRFRSHSHGRCAMCRNEWKINFQIFIFRVIVKNHRFDYKNDHSLKKKNLEKPEICRRGQLWFDPKKIARKGF